MPLLQSIQLILLLLVPVAPGCQQQTEIIFILPARAVWSKLLQRNFLQLDNMLHLAKTRKTRQNKTKPNKQHKNIGTIELIRRANLSNKFFWQQIV